MNGIDTVRVELPGDHWWEILAAMPYGVSRRVKRVIAPAMSLDGNGEMGLDPSLMTITIAEDVNVARLVGCSTAWSWGGEVTEEEIDKRLNEDVKLVLAEMDRLYQPRDEETVADLKKDLPSPSSVTTPSHSS